MRDKGNVDAKLAGGVSRRKPYRSPRLARLGTLTDITAAVGSHGKNDHAGPQAPLRKTS
jgi:hypothetical protein